MMKVRVIPCLDVRGGRVVKGINFQNLRDAGDPAERAARYATDGADELCLLDVSATPEERGHATSTTAAVRAVLPVPLTVGGGVRSVQDAGRLLEAGADKVAVNTAAVQRPALLDELAATFGAQCVVLSVDAAFDAAAGEHRVRVRSGTEQRPLGALAWIREASERGAGEILLTSFDRDGTRRGYDLDLLSSARAATSVPLIASGGASTPHCLVEAFGAGADAALAASLFHDNDFTVREVKNQLAEAGVQVRP
jgi:cyclase